MVMTGGTAVDKAFVDLLESAFGFSIIQKLKAEDPSSYLDLIREFEVIKRKVDINTKDRINMSFPFSPLNKLCQNEHDKTLNDVLKHSEFKEKIFIRGEIRFDAELIKSLFDSIIKNIIAVVNSILDKISPIHVPLMLLVGGFSECMFIQSSMKRAFMTKSIIVPEEAGLAVLKGAVLYGHHPGFIASRVMRYTYGTDSYTEFDPEEHEETRKEVLEGKSLCKVFQTIIAKNLLTLIGTKIDHDYQTMGAYQRSMTISIFTSDKEDPKYIDEDGCTNIGEAVVEIPHPSAEKRHVAVSYIFGKTVLGINAEELKTYSKCKTSINLV